MRIKEALSEKDNMINIQRSRITVCMTFLLSVLALFACLSGVLDKRIYEELLSIGEITKLLLVGSKGQDIIFIPFALLLAALSVIYLIRPGYKTFITILGLTGNFFYGYGLYAMQGQYTSIYLVYLVIFSLSIYSIVFGLLCFTPEFALKTSLPSSLRKAISIFLYFIAFILGLIWVIRITPDIARHIPQDTYGVFVLDLCIVFPAIAIVATKLIQRRPIGNILAGVALMKAFSVCLTWGFAEWYGRFEGVLKGSYEMLVIPSVLTLISFMLFVLYLLKLKKTT